MLYVLCLTQQHACLLATCPTHSNTHPPPPCARHPREFVINIISDWYVEAANHTCGAFPRGVDEMQLAGLTPVPSQRVRPPRVKESAVQMECRLAHIYPMINSLGQVGGHIVIGEILLIHVAEAVAGTSHSGKLVVDPLKLAPISRLGGITYGRLTELYDITRPQV